MHKPVILLVRPNEQDRETALDAANSFMSGFENGQVFDYYRIGGRWSNTLAPKYVEFEEWANNLFKSKSKEDEAYFISQRVVDDSKVELQSKWEELGMTGSNPFAIDSYSASDDGDIYDVVPLSSCIDIVNKAKVDSVEYGKQLLEEAENWLTKTPGNYHMYGYGLRRAGAIFAEYFNFECNVYNVEKENYSVPDDTEGWWAVMVDMHS